MSPCNLVIGLQEKHCHSGSILKNLVCLLANGGPYPLGTLSLGNPQIPEEIKGVLLCQLAVLKMGMSPTIRIIQCHDLQNEYTISRTNNVPSIFSSKDILLT